MHLQRTVGAYIEFCIKSKQSPSTETTASTPIGSFKEREVIYVLCFFCWTVCGFVYCVEMRLSIIAPQCFMLLVCSSWTFSTFVFFSYYSFLLFSFFSPPPPLRLILIIFLLFFFFHFFLCLLLLPSLSSFLPSFLPLFLPSSLPLSIPLFIPTSHSSFFSSYWMFFPLFISSLSGIVSVNIFSLVGSHTSWKSNRGNDVDTR